MQQAIKKLLYSTDLSPNSSIAFSYAVYLAKLTGAEIHVLHVLERLSDDAAFALQAYVQNAQARRDMLGLRMERAKKRLNERLEVYWSEQDDETRAVRAQIRSVAVCESYPAEEILKTAKNLQCDLIVLGSHERGVSHTFLGSVAKSVLRRSPVPTLIVPLAETD